MPGRSSALCSRARTAGAPPHASTRSKSPPSIVRRTCSSAAGDTSKSSNWMVSVSTPKVRSARMSPSVNCALIASSGSPDASSATRVDAALPGPSAPPIAATARTAAVVATTAIPTTPATFRVVRWRRRKRLSPDKRTVGTGGISASETISITFTGSSSPLNRLAPRSTKRSPSTLRVSDTTVSLARISPDAACEQSRAARFKAPPRKPPSTGTASPASRPIPTPSGNAGTPSVRARTRRCKSTAARRASLADVKTPRASSPRSSRSCPPCDSIDRRASSANRAASRAASSSPRSCVKRV